jgi:hypothetical protein
MSRSTYVYVVIEPVDCVPIAAFTVKRELALWMNRHDPIKVDLYRLRDGNAYPDQIPVRLNPQTLEPMSTP